MNFSAFAYRLIKSEKKSLVVLKDNVEIEKLSFALEFFSSTLKKDVQAAPFYSYEIPPHSSIKPASHIVSGRLKTLFRIINGSENTVVITNLNALLQPVISEEAFIDRFFEIAVGKTFGMDEVFSLLLKAYYERVDFIEDVGEFAKRGYLLDVFTPFYDKPLRIEYFDDEIEKIKLFYLENYRTYKNLQTATILPAKEYPYEDEEFGYILLKERSYLDRYEIGGFEKYSFVSLSDLEAAMKLISFYREEEIFNSGDRVESFLEACDSPGEDFSLTKLFPSTYSLEEKVRAIVDGATSFRVVVACGSKTRVEHVSRFFKDRGIRFKRLSTNPFELPNGIYLTDGYLYEGVLDRQERFCVVSFADLFGESENFLAKKRRSIKKSVSFSVGDRVVHRRYGVALFKGLKRIDVDGREDEFFELEFDQRDRVYLPVYNAELIDEYHGAEPLSSLRNNKWQRAQDLAKRSIKKILSELVNTYAKRHLIRREPYDVELYEIKEFEAMFDYDETPDQMKAIEDVKRDMASSVPMDRLICGDVSFGKTEIAMRAIAITVFNLRQAVFMVPTTLLSLQHFKTLKDRFRNFPVNIALLNRFTTRKEKEKIFEGLRNGSIDVLVATHSVYSSEIEFLNLGLVVVDEEHRFGVKVKEHLKSKYPHVDMLYMSATPIPRTLNMSLNGIMDISVIKTPPLERKPIETLISKRKTQIIRDAILRELSRDGRVYFVHNSIESIENVLDELNNIVPFAKKAIVHAKMPKRKIKEVFESFNRGEIDVLISTSIIESGLDIKSVDTIIIDDADRFGLSDLYQLRGRVGRGDRISYAYLLYRGKLTESASKRLKYMVEFIERGTGFNLALKDMELRGYGNILGKDQSGKIRSLGYSVYLSLIEEAVRELKNQPVERDVEIKHTFEAYVPDEFATGEKKVEIYKRLSASKDIEDVEQLKDEFQYRFGKIPEPVSNLFMIVSLKILSKKAFVKKIHLSPHGVLIEFYIDAFIDTDRLIAIVEEFNGRFMSETQVFFGLLGKNLKTIHEKLSYILDEITKKQKRRIERRNHSTGLSRAREQGGGPT